MYRILLVLSVLLCWEAGTVWANCVTLTLTGWTPAQLALVGHVAAQHAPEGVQLHHQAGNTVELCAPTTDLSGLTSAALQAEAQGLVDAHNAAALAQEQEQQALETEAASNPACNATSLQDALDKILTQQAAMQADIDLIDLATLQAEVTAIDTTNSAANIGRIKTALTTAGINLGRTKTALTTANTRRTTIDTHIVRCLVVVLKKGR